MLENAKRQLVLVALITAVAAFLVVRLPFKLGFDLKGGTQLIYEVPIEEAIEQKKLPDTVVPEQIMREVIQIIAERIDPTGTKDISPVKRGDRGILIELPDVTTEEADAIKRSIETLGRLEMRVIATDDYKPEERDETTKDEKWRFDLAKERDRLNAWLDADGNRAKVAAEPLQHIEQYNAIPASDKDGAKGRLSPHLQWYPRKIRPSFEDPSRWEREHPAAVDVFDAAQYGAGPGAEGAPPFLAELFPINVHERGFTGEDMNPAGISSGTDYESGTPAVFYEMNDASTPAYADLSQKYKNKYSAIILNGFVRSAPEYQSRIYRRGRITGGFTGQEATDLAKVLKTGSLPVKPRPVSTAIIGASLGEESIMRGMWSILIGGSLVLLFILAYYRLAGLVAFSALVLNVFLILGIMQFLRATFTLPGIAGLVLTMGMAIDANILIYERIREELARGKELLQAVRHGFERAMVTILDANITTFLTGLVLFNVGVGPVRGFAVTLMVGIITSVFTAFFVSRLVFHFLIEAKKLQDFHAAGWFQNIALDFLSKRRIAFAFSATVILGGLAYFAAIPKEHVFGLDFTGGANLNVAFKETASRAEVATLLKERDPEFAKQFPDPEVSTLGETTGAQAREFSVKLKLTDSLRQQIEEDKAAHAREKGSTEDWEPFYKAKLRQILADRLVDPAFSEVKKETISESETIASMIVHFTQPVAVAEVTQRLQAKFGAQAQATVVDNAEATSGRDMLVEFLALPAWTENDYIARVQQAFEPTDEARANGLKDLAGNNVVLSNPIPQAEQIGGRMVDELRNAAIGALVLSLLLIVFYIRVRFHEYKYGIAAVSALLHDVLITFGLVVAANHLGIVNAELNLAMIAAFLTIIGYSINDTIVIFDRVRENASDAERLGDSKYSFKDLLNRSINQTLSRTILTSGTTLFVVLAQFVVNTGQATALEGFSFALIIGVLTGTYSTIFIASPIVLWLRNREKPEQGESATSPTSSHAPEPAGV